MRGHYLKPNHRTETIYEAIWFDTETDQVELTRTQTGHALRQGWAAYARWRKGKGWSEPEWHRFETPAQFWCWVESKSRPRTKIYMFCHNSNFDYPVVDAFVELPRRGWVPGKIIAEGPPTMIELRKGRASLQLLDTLNWWRTSLKELGKSVGLPKLDMPADDAPQSDWDIYNRRDVEIIMQAVMRWCDFLRGKDLGGFAPTLASQSMRAYRHRFMDYPILIDDNERALACSRDCYHGGRTEAWFIGEKTGRFHLVDFHSMYPSVMVDELFPTKLAWYTRMTDAKDLRRMLRKYAVCARVRVKTDMPALPVVSDGKLIFPVGEFDCSISTPQLRWALTHAEILKVYEMSMYEAHPIFKRFIAELYALRLEAIKAGDMTLAHMFKILMNSLYGKWGQRGLVFEEVDRTANLNPDSWVEIDASTRERTKFRQLMGVIMAESKAPESGGSHPAIAAHVTAYASMRLWDAACIAGRDNVYYMDTDSLLVNDEGLDALQHMIHPSRLGTLGMEATYTDIDIRGAKDYRFGNKTRVKGVRASATWIEDNKVSQDRWSGLRGMIREGYASMPVTKIMVKTLTRHYDKGVVAASGDVSPLVLG